MILPLLPLLASGFLAAESPHVRASLVSPVLSVRPGEPVRLGLRLEIEPGWHVYWRNPGAAGLPPALTLLSPRGGTGADSLEFPQPDTLRIDPLMSYGYQGSVLLPWTLGVESRGDTLRVRASARWQVCHDLCLLEHDTVSIALPISSREPEPDPVAEPLFRRAEASLPRVRPGFAWRMSVGAEHLVLRATGADGVALPRAARFFPGRPGLVDDAAPQVLLRDPDGFRLILAREPAGEVPPDSLLEGVLGSVGWDGPGSEAPTLVEVRLEPLAASDTILPATRDAGGAATSWGPLLLALLGALVGGLALNLMPCVLPVLSLKVLDLLAASQEPSRRAWRHGLAFAAGVLASLWALAGLLIGLRAAGAGLGWGFQFQSPRAVALLSVLMVWVALAFWGVFEPGASWARLGGTGKARHSVWGAFLSGLLATLVATPCTGPFMGAAVGFALARPAPVTFAVFSALGIGMAAPVALLSLWPALLARLPRPGAWMETFKQFLGFPMAVTALWLGWVLGRLAGVDAVGVLGALWIAAGASAWVLGRWALPHRARRIRLVARLVALFLALGSVALAWPRLESSPVAPEASSAGEERFRPGIEAELRASGRPWLLHYTADWCLTCKVNELTVLDRPEVRAALARAGVRHVVADWTARDPAIARSLASFRREGVPLYVLGDGVGGETILPEVLSADRLLGALSRLSGP